MMIQRTFTFDGKRYSVRGKTEQEAIEKRALLKYDLEMGKRRITGDMRVSEWQERYLEEYKERSITLESYKTLITVSNVWVNPYIGDMKLSDVRHLHIQDIMNRMNGLSRNYINRVKFHLQSMFDKAISNGLTSVNPVKGIITPKATDGTRRALTKHERNIFLRVCETHKYGLWGLLMYYCGLRPGETTTVKWTDIDLNKRILHVRGTKTVTSNRYVPIPQKLAHKLNMTPHEPFDLLFTNKDGKALTKTNRRRYWEQIVKAMHIAMGGRTDYGELQRIVAPYMVAKDLVPYCLRHDFCTRLQAAGVPINVARELMGHTDIAMTSKIYTHSSPESFESAMAMMDSFDRKIV